MSTLSTKKKRTLNGKVKLCYPQPGNRQGKKTPTNRSPAVKINVGFDPAEISGLFYPSGSISLSLTKHICALQLQEFTRLTSH